MPRRFEIVSAPVEQRMQQGLHDQTMLAFDAAKGIFNTLEGKRGDAVNTTRALLNNREFVALVVGSGARLAMPSSLPGFLFLLAVLLRLVRWASIRFAASRAVAKHKSLVVQEGSNGCGGGGGGGGVRDKME